MEAIDIELLFCLAGFVVELVMNRGDLALSCQYNRLAPQHPNVTHSNSTDYT